MNLYTKLAKVYHDMYKHLFDYTLEYNFYHTLFLENKANIITEFGCGSGNLAALFIHQNYQYTGVDLNQEMLNIAVESLPSRYFFQDDMCSYKTNDLQDALLISGRSISYLNTDVMVDSAFSSFNSILKKEGLLVFDAIDAISLFEEFDTSIHELVVGKYKRISHSKSASTSEVWLWNWYASYFMMDEDSNEYNHIGDDHALVRAFTVEELNKKLIKSGFDLISIHEKTTYTWKDHYFVAKKI